ncbi:FAD-binding oxidoreductase [Luteolibacter sp. GHJ8]|uniref:FAD-binding oxidoreductase n=1 Tax=Luteolibacter rhizosphaerae TaxID=2989719 RepID=A0ABT3FZF3_9BACT|nr:FAD-dependent oxidoreductase [Luteolibacter rhizosphaerae]MCW1912957.1 FAD-binding oxidoreductase [Luteolibacter rhizosphaerae]
MNTRPCWFEDDHNTSYPRLDSSIETDILVVGGGVAGITAAYLLAREGFSVALVERDRLGGRDTGHTTAHLTYMTDTRLSDLTSTFSRDTARLAWEAGREAMEFIADTVRDESIQCDHEVVPGYLAAAEGCNLEEEAALLRQEALVGRQLGFDSQFLDRAPVTSRPGILFAKQAKFHPLGYCDHLAALATRTGAGIFEETEVTEFGMEPGSATAGGHQIRFKHVFVATHVPLQGDASAVGAASFQTKLALYSTYAIGAEIPKNIIKPMIWSDTADPFLYLRVESGIEADYCILGGEDHRTGQDVDTGSHYQKLERRLKRWIPEAVVRHRWSGQVVETIATVECSLGPAIAFSLQQGAGCKCYRRNGNRFRQSSSAHAAR